MLLAGRNCDGVTGADFACFAFDADSASAVGDVIDFFGFGMVMLASAGADGETCFGKVGEEFADFRAVFGDEGGDVVEIFYVHKSATAQSNNFDSGSTREIQTVRCAFTR